MRARVCSCCAPGQLQDVCAIELDHAVIRLDQAKDAFQQDRFSGARAADDDQRGAWRHIEVDAVQHALLAKTFRQTADANARNVRRGTLAHGG